MVNLYQTTRRYNPEDSSIRPLIRFDYTMSRLVHPGAFFTPPPPGPHFARIACEAGVTANTFKRFINTETRLNNI
jgi:hypothetical protein